MSRDDMSDYLVHWTSGSDQEAYEKFRNIVFSSKILSSNLNIKGSYNCICFTEAPEKSFHQILGRYKPFGIKILKSWLFERGGRPVIYGPSEEFNTLPEEYKWRHMRYDPCSDQRIDFLWEREWRIKCDELHFVPQDIQLLLPNKHAVDCLLQDYIHIEQSHLDLMALAYNDPWIMTYPIREFQYRYSIIDVVD